jgi:adenylyl-sulfate kinase
MSESLRENAARAADPSRGVVIWLTGLPAAGKTTLALELERTLSSNGTRVVRLDGDDLRRSVSADLGFSLADRSAQAHRVTEIALREATAGAVVVVALISPLRHDRRRARETVGPARFLEVYVATPLSVCRQRDQKGLYRRAEQGELAEFTGVSSPYEPPLAPDVEVHPELAAVADCAGVILEALEKLRCGHRAARSEGGH